MPGSASPLTNATYDGARGRIVALRFVPTGNIETWEQVDSAWVLRATGAPGVMAPAAGCAIAYDAARGAVLAFGGRIGLTLLSDQTWQWLGDRWVARTPAQSPPAREGAALAFDAGRGRVVLFGGEGSGGLLGDTWEWDGSRWQQRPVAGPAPRTGSGMTYDAARQRIVLYGAAGGLSDTWVWDGVAWAAQAPSASPPPSPAIAAYDAVRARVVMVTFMRGTQPVTGTWEWDGTTWSGGGQAPFGVNAIVSDARRGGVAALNWILGEGTGVLDWNGTAWTGRTNTPDPWVAGGPGIWTAIAYDAARAEVVVLQSYPGNSSRPGESRTFAWRGDRWHQVTLAAASPSGRAAAALAYDRARSRVVLFGGRDRFGNAMGDTWTFDGSSWQPRNPPTSPPSAADHAMAFDSARGRVVMHAGDTWEWDGVTWRAMLTAGQPRPLTSSAAMAYDPVRRRTVLFGAAPGPETWEWDGATWTRRALAISPAARAGCSMAWDPARRSVVLVGGFAIAEPPNDLWRYDGVSWSLASPGASLENGLVTFDEARGYLMVRNLDTWLLTDQPAVATRYGQDCVPWSTPSLSARGVPAANEPGFGVELAYATPARPVVFFLSATSAHVRFGACNIYVGAPFATFGLGTDLNGFAAVSLPIPWLPQLRGATLFAQAGVVESMGVTLSHGLALRVGD